MMDTVYTRSTLFGLIVLVHGAIFWVALFMVRNSTPPVAQAMMYSVLMPSDEPKPPEPDAKPVPPKPTPPKPPKPQTPVPQKTAIATEPVPVVDPQPQQTEQTQETSKETTPPAPTLPPRFDAAYLNNPAPVYPPVARRTHLEGRVLLRVYVSAEGTAKEVNLQQSSGSALLDKAAMDVVRRWTFVPGKQGSESVAAWVQVPFNFTLKD